MICLCSVKNGLLVEERTGEPMKEPVVLINTKEGTVDSFGELEVVHQRCNELVDVAVQKNGGCRVLTPDVFPYSEIFLSDIKPENAAYLVNKLATEPSVKMVKTLEKHCDMGTFNEWLDGINPVWAKKRKGAIKPEQTLPEKQAEYITQWIRDWFAQNGAETNAVIGISGGKDSTIAAALLVKALGPDRVIGVLMPNGVQKDINDAKRVVEFLGIKSIVVNIEAAVNALTNSLENHIPLTGTTTQLFQELHQNSKINLPPRVRMATLYAVAQSLSYGGMVCNTCNASEDYIGYSTKYGDAAGDFAPLQCYTVAEILAIGHALGLPADLVDKTPSDGLCGMSDEDRFGFSYAVLDRFIRTGICDDDNVKDKIIQMHNANLHKLRLIPACPRIKAV